MTLSTSHRLHATQPERLLFQKRFGLDTSNRKDKYLRLVGCCLLGVADAVDKKRIDHLLNDLGKGKVCAKPYEQTGASLWVSLDKYRLCKRSKFYPQVLNRFPHMLVPA